jgi:hypothetical protein
MENKIKIMLIILLAAIAIAVSLIAIPSSRQISESYNATLGLNEKQEIKSVSSGHYIELVGMDSGNKTATFLVYDKSATKESDKYKFTIEEGKTQGVAVEHCELIDVSLVSINSSGIAINITRKQGCVY